MKGAKANSPITDAVLDRWREAWGEPRPFPGPDNLNKGDFSKCHVTWERFEDNTYHVFLPNGAAAYRTNECGDPHWRDKITYAAFRSTYTPHAKMVEPDMELEEIHQAQALIANNGGMK